MSVVTTCQEEVTRITFDKCAVLTASFFEASDWVTVGPSRNLCKSPISYSGHACTTRQIDWRAVFVCKMSLFAESVRVDSRLLHRTIRQLPNPSPPLLLGPFDCDSFPRFPTLFLLRYNIYNVNGESKFYSFILGRTRFALNNILLSLELPRELFLVYIYNI